MKKLLGALAVLAFVGAGSAHAGVIYSNDFESGSTAGITGFTAITTAPSGEKFLGQLAENASSLLTVDTSGHNNLTLTFDFYAINSLDGTPDNFIVKINGVTVGDWWHHHDGNTTNPFAKTATSHLGYAFYGPDRTYGISFNIANGASTTIEFIGSTDQPSFDEGFGVDNIVLSGNTITGGIPEPSTWAMMILGFGAAGAAMRRRRDASALA